MKFLWDFLNVHRVVIYKLSVFNFNYIPNLASCLEYRIQLTLFAMHGRGKLHQLLI